VAFSSLSRFGRLLEAYQHAHAIVGEARRRAFETRRTGRGPKRAADRWSFEFIDTEHHPAVDTGYPYVYYTLRHFISIREIVVISWYQRHIDAQTRRESSFSS